MLSTTLLLAASMVVGQADDSPTYEYLKGLNCFVGDWLCVYVVEESASESEKLKDFVGKPATIRMSVRWSAGHGAQTTDMEFDFAGKFGIKSKMLTGWDPTTEKIAGYSFTNRGGCWKHIWSTEGGNWVDNYAGVNLDGTKQQGRRLFVFDGKDRLVIHNVNGVRGDKPLADSKHSFKRM